MLYKIDWIRTASQGSSQETHGYRPNSRMQVDTVDIASPITTVTAS